MVEFRITGENAQDVMMELAQMAYTINFAEYPWEHISPIKTPVTEAQPATEAKPKERPKPKMAEPAPKPKAETETENAISLSGLKLAARELDKDFGDKTFVKNVKEPLGFAALSELDGAQRQEVFVAIQKFRESHAG